MTWDLPDSSDPDGREMPIDIPDDRDDGFWKEHPRVANYSIVCKREDRCDLVTGLCIRHVSAGRGT